MRCARRWIRFAISLRRMAASGRGRGPDAAVDLPREAPAGTLGDAACISFHASKNVVSGEGGALVTDRANLAERAEIIREKGINRSRFLLGKVDKYSGSISACPI
jgi:dTDP-4-amino-4,6-dideoxygalactose transaminase